MHHISSLIFALLIAGSLAQSTDPVQLDKWAEFSLSVPRAYVAALTVNNYAVLAGGSLQNNTELTTVVDVLDLSTKTITQTNMSVARSSILAVSVGKYAIFAGGYNQTVGGTYVNIVEVLDVDSMQWKSTQFPEEFFSDNIGRYASNAASTDSLAVFFNGTHLAFYDPAVADAGAWNISGSIALTPSRFVRTSLATLGSIVYGFSIGAQLFAYNTATTDLIPLQPLDVLYKLTSVYTFAIGTNVYFSTTDVVYIYGTQSNTWEVSLFPQPLTNTSHILALSEKKIAVFDQHTLFIGDLDSFQWYGQSFDVAEASGLTLVAAKYIVIAGGYDMNSNVTDAVQVWQYTPSPPSAAPMTTAPNTSTTSSAHQIIASISFVILACIFSTILKH